MTDHPDPKTKALAAVLADTSIERHNVANDRPCRHCLNAWEQAERLLEHPHLLAALAEADVLREERQPGVHWVPGGDGIYQQVENRRYVTDWGRADA